MNTDPEDRLATDEDRRLVARFLATRSDQAFLRLYDRHTPALYRFAARIRGGPGAEPAEVVQETWVRAISRLDAFRWDSRLSTWLCGIAFNYVRERWRAADRDRKTLTLVDRETYVVADATTWSRALEKAIAELPEGYREVLLLHDLEGYTHEEIARHFGIVEGTSKSQLHRARAALRDALAAKEARSGG